MPCTDDQQKEFYVTKKVIPQSIAVPSVTDPSVTAPPEPLTLEQQSRIDVVTSQPAPAVAAGSTAGITSGAEAPDALGRALGESVRQAFPELPSREGVQSISRLGEPGTGTSRPFIQREPLESEYVRTTPKKCVTEYNEDGNLILYEGCELGETQQAATLSDIDSVIGQRAQQGLSDPPYDISTDPDVWCAERDENGDCSLYRSGVDLDAIRAAERSQLDVGEKLGSSFLGNFNLGNWSLFKSRESDASESSSASSADNSIFVEGPAPSSGWNPFGGIVGFVKRLAGVDEPKVQFVGPQSTECVEDPDYPGSCIRYFETTSDWALEENPPSYLDSPGTTDISAITPETVTAVPEYFQDEPGYIWDPYDQRVYYSGGDDFLGEVPNDESF
ncbi:MAG TPA: hypothetical protein VJH69_00880 [Candidatus Paceibacterota bacterium]